MSLFDILKYPLSDPPKYGEIKAIPEDVIRNWITVVDGIVPINYGLTIRAMFFCTKYFTPESIKVLKKLLIELP